MDMMKLEDEFWFVKKEKKRKTDKLIIFLHAWNKDTLTTELPPMSLLWMNAEMNSKWVLVPHK